MAKEVAGTSAGPGFIPDKDHYFDEALPEASEAEPGPNAEIDPPVGLGAGTLRRAKKRGLYNGPVCESCHGPNAMDRFDPRFCSDACQQSAELRMSLSQTEKDLCALRPDAPPADPPCDVYETALPNAEGLKFSRDKPPMHLLWWGFIVGIARVLGFGAKKYAAHNWRKGIPTSEILGACGRHLGAMIDGEDVDPESGLDPAFHLACELMFYTWMKKFRPDLDDRWKGTK